jgi:integrase
VFLWDDEVRGFGLRVTANGARSYVYQYRMGGREAVKRRYTIGKHGSPWTPATARAEAERLAIMVAQGVDPAETDKERRRQAVDLAFSSYVTTFARGYLDKEWSRASDVERMLVREAVPVLGAKPLPTIKKTDIVAVIDKLSDRPGTAGLAFASLRRMFNWAIGRGDLERSPMDGLAPPAVLDPRDRVLSDDEIDLVWRASETLGYPFARVYQLLIVTGQRRTEVAGLVWQELDRANAVWTLPPDRSKNGETHLVPLSALAIELLDDLAQTVTGSKEHPIKWPVKGFVFTTTGKTHVSGYSRAKERLDDAISKMPKNGAPMPDWVVHDLRRTLATGLQRLGVRFEVTEAVLNHISGSRSGIAGIYQRHDWKEEKRLALDDWAEHVAAILERRRGEAA